MEESVITIEKHDLIELLACSCAMKKKKKTIMKGGSQFQEGWGDFSPFFLPVQQESCLMIESKDIFFSSRRTKL